METTITAPEVQQSVQTLTVKEFSQAKGFVDVFQAIRWNANEYPYVTFFTDDNKAENIYFSRNNAVKMDALREEVIAKAKGLTDDQAIAAGLKYVETKTGEVLPKVSIAEANLSKAVMTLATNATGEQRWKIGSGSSSRISLADLF